MKLVGIEKIAEILDTSPKTIYDWTSTRKIPHYKVGRLVKFDVDAALEKASFGDIKDFESLIAVTVKDCLEDYLSVVRIKSHTPKQEPKPDAFAEDLERRLNKSKSRGFGR